MHHNKIQEKNRARQTWEGKFLFHRHPFDLTPPLPTDGPTVIKPTIDVELLCAHRLYTSQIATLTPLLLPVDVGLSPEDLIELEKEMSHVEEQLAPEDADLLAEKVMFGKKE